MELQGQEKEIGMPNPLGYHPHNRDSSSKLSSPSLIPEERRGGDQTSANLPQDLDQHQPYHHHQSLLLQPTHKPRRDQDPSSDPSSAGATSLQVAIESNLKPSPQPQAASWKIAAAASSVRYRECLKNHAATMGTHVVDGCGEFMPGGEEGTPESFKCAACDCHRNFHRKEINGESQYVANCFYNYDPSKSTSRRDIIPPAHLAPSLPPQHPHLQHHRYSHGFPASPTGPLPSMMMAFGAAGGAPAESSSEDLNLYHSNAEAQALAQPQLSKKRFRTKFTQEQKDKMMEFADKLGWKIQKQDEHEVQQFCSQVGVKRQVFKVWMHNNKQAMKRKQM